MDQPSPQPHPDGRPAGSENPSTGRTARRVDPASPAAPGESADRLTVLAHELANLLDGSLRSLTLASRSLAQTPADQPEIEGSRKRLDVVRHALVRMAELVDAAMRSAGQGGSIVPQPETPVELGEAVFHAVDVVTPLAVEHGVKIKTQVSNGLSGVPAGVLYPVVVNALTNAVEAITEAAASGGPGGGLVEVEAGWTEDGRIRLTIRDDGPGLRGADAETCFAFGFSTKRTGTGLGLAVAGAIVEELADSSIRLTTRSDLTDRDRPGAEFEVTFRPSADGNSSGAA